MNPFSYGPSGLGQLVGKFFSIVPWIQNMSNWKIGLENCCSGWWFQIFFIFIPIWENDPI